MATTSLRLGIIGTGRIARKLVAETRSIRGIAFCGAYNPNIDSAARFCKDLSIPFQTNNLSELFQQVDAVYIASPHFTHVEYALKSLKANCHVLSEKPLAFSSSDVDRLYTLARQNKLALLEGLKTAYSPGFRLIEEVVSEGKIGEIVDVDASFTKLVPDDVPELANDGSGGSMLWLASYPLYAIGRLMGTEYSKASFYSIFDHNGVDGFTRGLIRYASGTGALKVGFRAKTDGSLIVTGTKGFLVAPAPWWSPRRFEIHYEDPSQIDIYECECEGSCLKYEVEEFQRVIRDGLSESKALTQKDCAFIAKIIGQFKASQMICA